MHDGYLSAGSRIKLLALDLNHATYTIVQDTVLENLLADTHVIGCFDAALFDIRG